MLEFTAEQDAFRGVVREFAEAEIAPKLRDWDRAKVFPVETVVAMGELGLFGLPFPERWGGSGADFTTFCVALEELGRVDQSMAVTVEAGVGLGANPIFEFGTDAQRETWLPDLCAGRRLAGFGLTEPEAGSDAGGTRTRARLDEETGEWVIDGSKAFITNSGTDITSLVTVTARTDDPGTGGRPEVSTIIVPAHTPGFTVAPPYEKMGWHASDTHELAFSDCRVPAENLLGERGMGFKQFLSILDDGRIALAAVAVGVIRCCLEESVAYAKSRNAFGGPIGRYQAVSFKCADMQAMLDSATLLTYQAAALKDAGRDFTQAASVAKLVATESAVTATRMATQIFGGAGFMDATPVARQYRDAKIL
ncbi:MAG: acyl-CoA dehydrogenase family protein, partial [Actinobacteria bacterium]|nr:acyl-CoA dehydrogenase family protein [Actinomycetota bacterium]